MKAFGVLIGLFFTAAVFCSAQSESPVLSNIDAGHPAIQSSLTINVGGGSFSSGQVAYGAVGTPLMLFGSDFGEGGSVWFIPYKNAAQDGSPIQAPVSLWSETAIILNVPSNALTGRVEIVAGDKVSNWLPFVVINGTYSGACQSGQGANPVQITTDSLQDGALSHSYSATLHATGGSNSYTWSLVSGSLPAGLSLSSSGAISGTPTSSGAESTFTVQVADTSTPKQYDSAVLSIEIAAQTEGTSSGALYNFSIQTTSSGSGYDPVGNVVAYTDSVNGTWSFLYSMNRLATAAGSQADNPYPNLCWQYDSFGNRKWQTSSSSTYPSTDGGANSCPVSSGPSYGTSYNSSNHMTDGLHNYDAAGDIIADTTNGNSYLYDPEGRICAVEESPVAGITTMTQYIYDAEGQRVAKGSISTFSCDTTSNGFTPTTVYVLGPGGEQLSELTNTSSTQTPTWQVVHTNVNAAGQQIATYDADMSGATEGNLYFHLSDWLGTRRQQTDYAGNSVLNFTGQPYGDGVSVVPVSTSDVADATEHHYTGKERDSESGNDYFDARYYSSAMGRFMSPDFYDDDDDEPEAVPYADLENPQSLNLYGYVRNNPLRWSDPTGHGACPPCVDVEIPADLANELETWWATTGSGAAAEGGSALMGTLGSVGAGLALFLSPAMGGDPSEDAKMRAIMAAAAAREDMAHRKGKSKSKKDKHQRGERRSKKDQGGEKGDENRRPPRKPPIDPSTGKKIKGPWPPSNSFFFLVPDQKDNSSVTTTQGPVSPCGGSTGNPCPK